MTRYFPLRATFLSCVLWMWVYRCCSADGVTASTVIRVKGNHNNVSARGIEGGRDEPSTKRVDEFLKSLTEMIGTVLSTDAKYSRLVQGDDQQSVLGRPNRPAATDYFETGHRPPFLQAPQYGDRPYPPQSQDGRPGFLGNLPPDAAYGQSYPGGPGQYPQSNSVLQALTSISRHDDLRCVPRLLCEVSSGARPSSSGYYQPGYYYQQQQQQQQQSTIPFLSKDALVTFLTVLNFVDDSPLLMFGRAALLGYNARGDPRSCHNAYPTCPKDPDQLINYLNNHNGGFFRFFNQQLPQFAPQYAHQQSAHPQRPSHYSPLPDPQRPPPHRYSVQQQYATGYRRPAQHFGDRRSFTDDYNRLPKPRILSGTPAQYFDVPSVQDLALELPSRPWTTIPPDHHHTGAANAVPLFAFPSDGDGDRRPKNIKMVFPDRTGTGGLRAEVDEYGNYKGVYYADGTIKFVDKNATNDEDDGMIKIPSQWSWPDLSRRPGKAASGFHVLGNRLPYDKRSDFKFPKTP